MPANRDLKIAHECQGHACLAEVGGEVWNWRPRACSETEIVCDPALIYNSR